MIKWKSGHVLKCRLKLAENILVNIDKINKRGFIQCVDSTGTRYNTHREYINVEVPDYIFSKDKTFRGLMKYMDIKECDYY